MTIPKPEQRAPIATPFAPPPASSSASTSASSSEPPPARTGTAGLLVAVTVGTLVSVGLGVYGRAHEAAFFAVSIAGFSSGTAAKAWLATGAFVLVLVQVGSAMVMYGRFPGVRAPSWIGGLHRWSGRAAVLLTVPVAVHCLYALGFQDGSPRVLLHSLFGCFFYGAFVAKMLVLNRPGSPRWSLPVLGGALFTALVALWLTSSLWFFTTSGLTF
ncbi:MAG: DUF6529 family protein [Pseudonocardia sp.]|nr:DUF6529 family protein [Pseudonocardia sp.]